MSASVLENVIIESAEGFEDVCISSELESFDAYSDYELWLDQAEAKEAWWSGLEMETPYH